MERWGQIPSQPSNFVSILHLRERWLKENERNQKEKEDLKQLDQQEQQQKVHQTEPEEKDDQKPVVRKTRINASSWSRNGSRKFQRYYRAVPVSNPRNVNETCKKTEDEGEPELAVPKVERDEKTEKKSKRKGRKKNPRAQKEEIDKTSPTPEKNLKEETKECEIEVQNGKKNVRARKIDEKTETVSQCGPEKTGYTHEMKEMENKLSLISVSFEIKRGRNNGVYRGGSQGNRNFRDPRNLDRWGPRKQRDIGMIWVRKDELSKVA
ncbi:gelsolin-related protein of 125 kDa-like [Benincasa hispida]|uniref:gelsolin-related protein of 125 kDa-like n=1 Tax=Benincasa hispida TaxID=102211 RepID=UPI001902376A|nr:gelsolin-related protein of 125 kDa-like [Benincasa hispida]XP_038884415.1 gelsolin-related protein of 125 kDa-like [Benincasa hispida]